MTRRLVLALLGTLVAALVLVGSGTLVLAWWGARQGTEAELRRQAADLAEGLSATAEQVLGTRPQAEPARVLRTLLVVLRRTLRLDGLELVVLRPTGAVLGTLPDGVVPGDLPFDRLRAGEVVSGHDGRMVFASAAVPAGTADGLVTVVIAREADAGLRPAVRWFLVAGALTVAVGAVVAVVLGRRLTGPLRAAEEATRRLAAGDLGTRLAVPTGGPDDEVASLTRSINAMAEALERSRTVEQQFLLSVSHDLRTPLTSIRGYAEAVAEGATTDPQHAGRVILAESRRLERLVLDLLDLARLQARRFSLHPTTCDLVDVAHGVADGFASEAHDRSIRIVVDAPSAAPVWADPDRLAQLAANLVDNALRYARTTVAVTVRPVPSGAELLVDDDGPGIAPEDLPHVFERLSTSRQPPGHRETGAGLGLAIVRELTEAMHGEVRAEVAPLGGARLAVRLPAPLVNPPAAPPPPAR